MSIDLRSIKNIETTYKSQYLFEVGIDFSAVDDVTNDITCLQKSSKGRLSSDPTFPTFFLLIPFIFLLFPSIFLLLPYFFLTFSLTFYFYFPTFVLLLSYIFPSIFLIFSYFCPTFSLLFPSIFLLFSFYFPTFVLLFHKGVLGPHVYNVLRISLLAKTKEEKKTRRRTDFEADR